MESAQRQLRAWFANGLSRHDAYGSAQGHHVAASQINAITFGAYAVRQFTGQRRAHFDFGHAGRDDFARQFMVYDVVGFANDFAGLGVNDALSQQAAVHAHTQ